MNSRVSISRRLAVATMLTVLSTSAAFAQVKNLSVRGSFDGHSIGVVQGGTLQASGGGAGNASHIGRFTYVLNATVNLANGQLAPEFSYWLSTTATSSMARSPGSEGPLVRTRVTLLKT